MAIFLTADSKVIVQGMTGSEGMKHTQRMLASGTNVVEGRRILTEAAHPLVTLVDTMDDAADKAAELAGSAA